MMKKSIYIMSFMAAMLLCCCEKDKEPVQDAGSNAVILNGHDYVDLGLSVKWATMNVGADSISGYGDYFAWGETGTYYSSLSPLAWKTGKEDGYTEKSYFDYSASKGMYLKYHLRIDGKKRSYS